jgi:hypothetical protein
MYMYVLYVDAKKTSQSLHDSYILVGLASDSRFVCTQERQTLYRLTPRLRETGRSHNAGQELYLAACPLHTPHHSSPPHYTVQKLYLQHSRTVNLTILIKASIEYTSFSRITQCSTGTVPFITSFDGSFICNRL